MKVVSNWETLMSIGVAVGFLALGCALSAAELVHEFGALTVEHDNSDRLMHVFKKAYDENVVMKVICTDAGYTPEWVVYLTETNGDYSAVSLTAKQKVRDYKSEEKDSLSDKKLQSPFKDSRPLLSEKYPDIGIVESSKEVPRDLAIALHKVTIDAILHAKYLREIDYQDPEYGGCISFHFSTVSPHGWISAQTLIVKPETPAAQIVQTYARLRSFVEGEASLEEVKVKKLISEYWTLRGGAAQGHR